MREQNDFPPGVVDHPAYRQLEAIHGQLRDHFEDLLTQHRLAHGLLDFYGVPRKVDPKRHGDVTGGPESLSMRIAELATNTGHGAGKRLEAAEAKLRQLRGDECVGYRIASVVTALRGQYPDSHDRAHSHDDWTLLFMEQVGKLAKLTMDGPKDDLTLRDPVGKAHADAAVRYRVALAIAQLAWSYLRVFHMENPHAFGNLTLAGVPPGAGKHAQEDLDDHGTEMSAS